jgi:hypothetical protein
MRATFHLLLCASAVAGLLVFPACTQDENASTAERDTHMGAAGHQVDAAPPLPAAVNPPPPVAAPAPAPVAPMPAGDAGGDAAPAKAADAGAAADAAPAKPKRK